jgi:hypothetical protein
VKRVGIVAVAILMAGCGQLTWIHPSGPADFERDALACDQAGVHASGGGADMMAALNVECMKAHGWELEQSGSL